MYSSNITKYLTPMFFKGDKTNLLPDLEVIGLDQKAFVDPTKKLEIRNLYGLGSAHTCDYLHQYDPTNEVSLVEKTTIPKKLLKITDELILKDAVKPLISEMETKIVKNEMLLFRMCLNKDIHVDNETVHKFILVADNKHIDFRKHTKLLKFIEKQMNIKFSANTGTLNKVVSADYMIEHYKKLLLEEGL